MPRTSTEETWTEIVLTKDEVWIAYPDSFMVRSFSLLKNK